MCTVQHAHPVPGCFVVSSGTVLLLLAGHCALPAFVLFSAAGKAGKMDSGADK